MTSPTANPSFAPQRGLRVRHAAAELAQITIAAADAMPDGRRGLFADQMRRAAISIHANLAEGEGRATKPDRVRFFQIAWASLRELEAHADLAMRAGALTASDAAALRHHCRQVGRMLHALLHALAP